MHKMQQNDRLNRLVPLWQTGKDLSELAFGIKHSRQKAQHEQICGGREASGMTRDC